MKTIGQAIDEAIAEHQSKYPESKVYAVYAVFALESSTTYKVELGADHFSQWLVYSVKKDK